ncbi:MAG TPA: integrase [Sedimenticola sp.]|nr:integrase [Sedimenticola sp.]
MPEQLPTIEVIQGPSAAAGPGLKSGRRSRRLLVFLAMFVLCAAAGLFYTYSRPAVYRATAALLTVAMPAVDQPGAAADIQHVSIQRQLLLGQPLLQEVLERLEAGDDAGPVNSVARLQGMLSVDPLADTNIVKLSAEGPVPELLPRVVNTWVNVYLEMRARKIKEATGATTEALQEQYQALAAKLEAKRAELDRFRRENNILSMGRDENQVIARLKGLTTALNTASEEEVRARAELDAIRKAIAKGKPVVPKEEQSSLAALEASAQALREKLIALRRRYTDEFISVDPNLKIVPKQLKEVQKEIAAKVEYGRKIVLAEAEQKLATARQSVKELQTQLKDHKSKATRFTARFAEHEALQEDLASLEELYRTTEERLVAIEVENRQKFPQVNVLEYAQLPVTPVRPQYLRDAAIALAASLLTALFAVWLVEFLLRREERPEGRTLAGVRIYTQQQPAISHPSAPPVAIAEKARPALQQLADTELDAGEIRQVFKQADRTGKRLIALLMSGLSPEEATRVDADCFDFATGRLRVPGGQARTIALAPTVLELFCETASSGQEPAPDPLTPDDLAAILTLAAVDAGLPDPERVNAAALQHSYLAYLVRQGVRLSEIPGIAGDIPATRLASYAQLSPPGPGKALDEIELAYPLTEPDPRQAAT